MGIADGLCSVSELTAFWEEWLLGFQLGEAMLVKGSGVRNSPEMSNFSQHYPVNLLFQHIQNLKEGILKIKAWHLCLLNH